MSGIYQVEDWWDGLSDARKIQIYQWLECPRTNQKQHPNQIFLIDEEGEV